MKKLPTFEEMQKQYGEFVKTADVVKLVCVSNGTVVKYYREGHYNQLAFQVGKDIEPEFGLMNHLFFIKSKLDEIVKITEEVKERNKQKRINTTTEKISGIVLKPKEAALVLGIPFDKFLSQLKKGKWNKYVQEHSRKWDYAEWSIKYSDLDKNMLKYFTLPDCAKFLNSTETLLWQYKTKGFISQPTELEGTRFWDLELLRKQFEAAKKVSEKRARASADWISSKGSWNYLSKEHQLDIIDEYVRYRSKDTRIRWEDKDFYSHGFIKPEKTGQTVKMKLSVFLFRAICAKCGIQEMESGSGIVKTLSKSQLDKFDPTVLDLRNFDLTVEDLRAYFDNLQPTTISTMAQIIHPFIMYLLMRLEDQFSLWRIDQDVAKKYYPKRNELLKIANELPKATRNPANEANKVFLSRKEVLQVYQRLDEMHRADKSYESFKRKAAWMISCFLGIRPEEIVSLRIEHFALDNDGLIATNSQGYGFLRLPTQVTKMQLSGSHEKYGTLVVPNLVKLLNEYFKYLYKFQDQKGTGYLFRPRVREPEKHTKRIEWMNKLRKEFEFLSEQKRNRLEIKTGRRSMREFIEKTPLPMSLYQSMNRAAQIHMRHNVNRKSDGVKSSYTKDISLEEYFAVIDRSLNFDWNLDRLKDWEIASGCYQESKIEDGKFNVPEFETNYESKTIDFDSGNDKIVETNTFVKKHETQALMAIAKEELERLEKKLYKLRNDRIGNLGVSTMEKLILIDETIKEINDLRSIIQGGGVA